MLMMVVWIFVALPFDVATAASSLVNPLNAGTLQSSGRLLRSSPHLSFLGIFQFFAVPLTAIWGIIAGVRLYRYSRTLPIPST
jgi:hypothetical protein